MRAGDLTWVGIEGSCGPGTLSLVALGRAPGAEGTERSAGHRGSHHGTC